MSRSGVSKSRSDKTRTTALPAATPPITVIDIVPGRLTESEWQSLAMSEEGDSNVMDIIDDLVGLALEQVYSLHIEEQLLPFTIAQAREAILQIIEWRFLNHDSGESNVALDHSWHEDTEPTATGTDSWAQGSVPLMPAKDTQVSRRESREGSRMEEGQSGIRRVASPAGQGTECGAQPLALRPQDTSLCRWMMGLDQEEEQEETEIEESLMTIVPAPQNFPQPHPKEAEVPAEASTAGRERYRPQGKCCHRKSDKQQQAPRSMDRVELAGHQQQVAELPRSVGRLELEVPRDSAPSPCATFWMPRCVQMMLKSQRTRLPSSNAVTFDQFGNISSVQRLEAGRFRWHRPAPVFQLLEEATGCGRCRRRGDPPLRRLVFRSPPLPLRPGTGRRTGMPGRAAGKPPSAGVAVGQRSMLPHAQPSPDFPEFIPDGPKDRNHPHCGRHPQWEASSLDQLQPISSSLVLPPIALEQLAVDLSL